MREGWGWAGTVGEFLSTPVETWRRALTEHHAALMGIRPAGPQERAWDAEHAAVASALRASLAATPAVADWGIAFEYELPMEGGRRPDVVVLAGSAVLVLEFKDVAAASVAAIDQVAAYASDLSEFHEATHGRTVIPIVVLTGTTEIAEPDGDVIVTSGDGLAHYLIDAYAPGDIDLSTWLHAPYTPLPTLVAAARRIFRDEPLPHVRRALAVGIPETVELVNRIVDEAERAGHRVLAFVTGVPGSGKTLVGLRVVYERKGSKATATFLSGNGPLVAVLQDALKSRGFVRDLHKFITSYGETEKVPDQHVLVFDEAQRAWDRAYMHHKRGVARSEPELLVAIGERLPRWTALVGLVGDGQEIHSGEESGMPQWRAAAMPPSAHERWSVHCAPRLADEFAGLDVHTHDRLDLTVSLRTKRAERLHEWVARLLNGSPQLGHPLAQRIKAEAYPLYLTRDLDAAKAYVRAMTAEAPEWRTGLLASSHAKVLPDFDIDNSFMATSRMNIAKWFNAPPDDPKSSNALRQPVTEFGCQGLELDLPIVCWGEDYRWEHDQWRRTPIRRKYRQDEPEALLLNAYRVLLTRGREGVVVYLPDDRRLDLTEMVLLAAGLEQLPETLEAVGEAAG